MTSRRSEDSRDSRWDQGMVGWRARVIYPRHQRSNYGEVTGFESPSFFWLVFDGEEEPVKVRWAEVRPA